MSVWARGRHVQRWDVGVDGGSAKTCIFWLQGKCTRNPCRFMHRESPPNNLIYRRDDSHPPPKTHCLNNPTKTHCVNHLCVSTKKLPRKFLYNSHNQVCKSIVTEESNNGASLEESSPSNLDKSQHMSSGEDALVLSTQKSESVTPRIQNKMICEHWISGNCVHGDECCFQHSWFLGGDFIMLAKLEGGPNKAITGITLPSGSDKLYTCSIDGTTQVWDCHTGQCTSTQQLGLDVGSSICEGPWVFVGMPNVVLAWNSQSTASFYLNGPAGQVRAMVFKNDILFAGDEDGVILAWKYTSSEPTPFQPATSYRGHTSYVTCLTVGDKTLYSGSADHTIRMWNLETSACVTLIGHTDVVMSLVCWKESLISCSLDKSIKAWAYEQGNLKVVYTHHEEHGVIALSGMHDAQGKPILFCSCNDNGVRLYDLPSFNERGRMFSRAPVGVIQSQSEIGGLVFTGDTSGSLTVWKWVAAP